MERLDCDRMFVAVMELGSFAAAAARLGTSSGQASKLVARLESELGVQLLKRSTRALSPTEVGLAYFDRIKNLLEEWDALDASVRHAAGKPTGRIKLSAPITFGASQLAPVLIAFAREYPEIELDVNFSDRLVNIVDEGFDVAIRIGRLSDSRLIARHLSDMRVVIAASDEYLSEHGTPTHYQQLVDHSCIIDTNFRDPFNWPFSVDGEAVTLPVRGRLHFSNAEASLTAALSGLGIARLPTFIAGPALRAGTIRPLLRHSEIPPLGLYAVYPPARHLAHKVRALIDFLVSHYAGEPEWDRGW
ncbi:LysR substrate-binding domain-containing protein [Pantoea coffeiphila]|uniref:LysR substrate-binding domain-containing protein n=1 Tax=Pantoea coffeiphila TaxID=1465635 RepID=UPI00195FD0B5|nr:DNA-binding transcriptional LysR family regulator [Pantoea coffeiphila]